MYHEITKKILGAGVSAGKEENRRRTTSTSSTSANVDDEKSRFSRLLPTTFVQKLKKMRIIFRLKSRFFWKKKKNKIKTDFRKKVSLEEKKFFFVFVSKKQKTFRREFYSGATNPETSCIRFRVFRAIFRARH